VILLLCLQVDLGNGFLQNALGEILTMLKSVGTLAASSEGLGLLPEQFSSSFNPLYTPPALS